MASEPALLAQSLEDLAPLVAELRRLQRGCRPFGRDYHAISVSLAALDELALDLTDQPSFYGAASDTVGPVMRLRGLE